jgi:hypothetical protein
MQSKELQCDSSNRLLKQIGMARGVSVDFGAVAASQSYSYRGSSRRFVATSALALVAVAAVCFVAQTKSSSSETL